MPTPAATGPRRMPRRARAAGLALSLATASSGCFDSDDKGLRAAPVDTTGDSTGPIDPDTSTGLPPRPPIGDGGNGTCAQALGCLGQCIVSVQQQLAMGVPELDLSCFLECDGDLSVEQATVLLRLFECSYDQCATTLVDDEGEPFCELTGGTSTGAETSTGGSDSGSSTTAEPPPPPPDDPSLFDPCTLCLLQTVNDDNEPNCAELRMMCQ